MNKYYILLGTNQGDLAGNLETAKELLAKNSKIIKISSVYETEPFEMAPDTPVFLNQALLISSDLNIEGIKEFTKGIEDRMGKESRENREEEFLDRIIDIDILFAGETIINNPLILPHPEIQNRRFVLAPLCEIAAKFYHPTLKKPVLKLLNECNDKSLVKKI